MKRFLLQGIDWEVKIKGSELLMEKDWKEGIGENWRGCKWCRRILWRK